MAKRKLKPSMPPIFELAIDDVKPYDNNPRFNEDAVPAVAESLKEFGWRQPVVVSVRQGNEIVVGHTRVAAAKSLGWKSVPCIDASDLSDEQIRAYRLADNKTNEGASWDEVKLSEELDALPMFDMERFGFKLDGDADLSEAFGDGGEGLGEMYKDADKVNFKIPIEYLERVRKWLREGGRGKTIRWILVQSGCIEDGDPLPEGVETESEEDED
jgi:hypothetical protein